MDDLPQLAWPIRVDGYDYVTVQQDTDDEVAANIAVLYCFERGWRAEQPDYGITDPTFQQMPVNTAELERQAAVYEPRAELKLKLADDGTGGQQVTVGVRIAVDPEPM